MRWTYLGLSMGALSLVQGSAGPLLKYKGIAVPPLLLDTLWYLTCLTGIAGVGFFVMAFLPKRRPPLASPSAPETSSSATDRSIATTGQSGGTNVGRDYHQYNITPATPPPPQVQAEPPRNRRAHFSYEGFCWK